MYVYIILCGEYLQIKNYKPHKFKKWGCGKAAGALPLRTLLLPEEGGLLLLKEPEAQQPLCELLFNQRSSCSSLASVKAVTTKLFYCRRSLEKDREQFFSPLQNFKIPHYKIYSIYFSSKYIFDVNLGSIFLWSSQVPQLRPTTTTNHALLEIYTWRLLLGHARAIAGLCSMGWGCRLVRWQYSHPHIWSLWQSVKTTPLYRGTLSPCNHKFPRGGQ